MFTVKVCMFDKRIEELYLKTIKTNRDYIEISLCQKKLFNRVQLLLPEKDRHTLVRLDDYNSRQSAIIEKVMYENGIRDCIKFLITT